MAYRPASFRGVRFHVLEVAPEKGKRLDVNEFHGRDTPYTESHGRKARRWTFRAFMLGADAPARALALATACEANGAGQLTLPSEGSQLVECETCRPVESAGNGRYVQLDLTFVEKGSAPGLIVTALAGIAALSAATALVSTVSSLYSTALAALDQIGLSIVADTILSVAANLGTRYYVATDTTAQAAAALAILDLRASDDPATSAATALPVIVSQLRAAGAGVEVFASPSSVMPANVETDAECVTAFVRRLFIIEEARALTERTLKSRDEADSLRAAFITRMDAEIDVAAVAREGELLTGLRKLEANTVRDLIDRGRPLPRIQTYTVPGSLPAVVIAHRLWQDASRASEVVSETGALHPGFMPTTIKALSA